MNWWWIVVALFIGIMIGGFMVQQGWEDLLNDCWDLNDEIIDDLKECYDSTIDYDESTTQITLSLAEEEIVKDCSGKSLERGVDCIVKKVEADYNYKIQPDNLNMTLEQINDEGGDCHDYALLYERLGKGVGYEYSTTIVFNMGEFNHRITIISDGKDYCVIDQFSPSFCVPLGDSDD